MHRAGKNGEPLKSDWKDLRNEVVVGVVLVSFDLFATGSSEFP